MARGRQRKKVVPKIMDDFAILNPYDEGENLQKWQISEQQKTNA